MTAFSNIIDYSLQLGRRVLETRTQTARKRTGQFLTPTPIARFMARQLEPFQAECRVLDPAIGAGTLTCAIIERVMSVSNPTELWIEGYETDAELCRVARHVLDSAAEAAAEQGITIHTTIHERDFILDSNPVLQPELPLTESSDMAEATASFTHIIANPPYFKLNRDDPRVAAVAGKVKGHTNIYTLFIAVAVKRLAAGGRACFIIPRSFCSGAYFSAFRRELVKQIVPAHVHLFESREQVFKREAVLQENIIFTFHKQCVDMERGQHPYLSISTSRDAATLDKPLHNRRVSPEHFLGKRQGRFFFRLPTTELDEHILNAIDSWSGSLAKYGLEISTGPIVPFRAAEQLADIDAVERGQAVPLLWMHNVKAHQVLWPAPNGNKPQGVWQSARDAGLLLPKANYILLRRFSAKEEPRRLIAAPLLSAKYAYEWVGLENHLNYIRRKVGTLKVREAIGLVALFNSALIDRYFRIINGNTQVNATELRALPLPPLAVIERIGAQVEKQQLESPESINALVFSTLYEQGYLDDSFPIIKETRIKMGKIQEAQEVLRELGLPPAQQNEISALTLLVLAQLSEDTPWNKAKTRCLRIHDILDEMKNRYDREYAENTRETIRRQVLHQFVQAGVAVPNPDEPDRATNSPHFCYALSDLTLRTVKAYASAQWSDAVRSFQSNQDALIEIYKRSREQLKVKLCLESGETYFLSPGKHNELQASIIEEFGPRFVPGGTLIYLGDTARKTVVLEESVFEELNIPAPSHEKLPDVIIYDRERNWLFLVEAVTSHGPISPKRHLELEEILQNSSAGRVYVTAFPDLTTFKNFLTNIAWETEVWIAEIPDHLIHFNGDRLMNPRS